MTVSGSRSLDGQLRAAPARPGCYLFRDVRGTVLYVGKARELRARVQVYRKPGADGRGRLADLLDHAVSVEFFVTETEPEAVLLEDRLVKLHQPARNVLLKDDKAFLFLHLDTRHPFPRLGLARRRAGPGEFFGPHASAGAARRAKRLIQKAFGLRDCSDHTLQNRARPCLKHPLGLCTAPCVGMIGMAEYERALGQAREVLAGNVRAPLREARRRMDEASARLDFETALRERNRARALEALSAPQLVRLDRTRDFDVLGLDVRGQFALLEYRDGDWVSTRTGRIRLAEGRARALGELVPALYRDRVEIPPEILLPELPEEAAAIEGAFSKRAGRKVRLSFPQRGERRALLRLA
ncbi:MAG: GIY-YIG nuclease family protein, partial [Planctomycetota bacterium]